MRRFLIAAALVAAACGRGEVAVDPTPKPDDAAVQARADLLESAGGSTALLSLAATETIVAGKTSDAAATAALAALERMNADAAAAISRLAPGAADEFAEAWQSHVVGFRAYVEALVKRDEPARLQALADLARFSVELSKALPGVPAKLAAEYVEHVRNTIDAAAAGDLARSALAARTAQDSLDQIAVAAIEGAKVQGSPRTARAALVSSLTRSLTERSVLIAAYASVGQRRQGGRSGAEAPLRELGAALDENAVAVATAFSSAFPGAEPKLLALLRSENSTVIARQFAGTAIDRINADIAKLLGSTVTHMRRSDAARLCSQRARDVRKIVSAFRAGKPSGGYAALYDAIHQDAAFAEALTAAASAQAPERFGT